MKIPKIPAPVTKAWNILGEFIVSDYGLAVGIMMIYIGVFSETGPATASAIAVCLYAAYLGIKRPIVTDKPQPIDSVLWQKWAKGE